MSNLVLVGNVVVDGKQIPVEWDTKSRKVYVLVGVGALEDTGRDADSEEEAIKAAKKYYRL